MEPGCQIAARTGYKPCAIASPPTFSNSAGISIMPTVFPPFCLEIASLTTIWVGGSSLKGWVQHRDYITTSIQINCRRVYLLQLLKIPSLTFTNNMIWDHLSIHRVDCSHLRGGLGVQFSKGLVDGYSLGNGIQPPPQDSWWIVPCPLSAVS